MSKDNVVWGNPGALGLAAFGFNTILLQVHNIGLIPSTMPLIWGLFWGGAAQVIAGVIDGRRGDTFGLTAFTSYGFFWIGLASAFLLEWIGLVTIDNASLAYSMIAWGAFTTFMTFGALKISRTHVCIFAGLSVLFFLLAGHFFGHVPAMVAGIEGMFVGGAAVYGAIAVIMHAQYRRWVVPLGLFPAVSNEPDQAPKVP